MMTRKDYIEVAKIINKYMEEEYCGGFWPLASEDFADMFEKDNPRFNREKFLEACGTHVYQ